MKFAIVATKRKARRLALGFRQGASILGHTSRMVTRSGGILPDEVGVFYGITSETRPDFERLASQGRALYLDNGWLSNPIQPSLRWAWNSVQAFYEKLQPRSERLPILKFHSDIILRGPLGPRDTALLCLQSEAYFAAMKLPYTRDQWTVRMKEALEVRGYHVTIRQKPSKYVQEPFSLDHQLAQSALVVSLNSAVTVRALTRGVPAFCALECTLTPACLDVIGTPDSLRAAKPKVVRDLLYRLAQVDFTYSELANGTMLNEALNVHPSSRTGHVYGLGITRQESGRRLPSEGRGTPRGVDDAQQRPLHQG